MSTTTRRPFYSAFWNFPGCLPEGDSPPPVFGDYRQAAEYLADVLDEAASGYEEDEEDGDSFVEAARECRESTESTGFAFHGPDGLNYYTEEIDPRGVWTANDRDGSDGFPDVLLTYGPGADDATHAEAAEEILSVCGSSIEAPADVGAYVLVDSTRLREAAGELRESGYLLLDVDGEEIDPEGPEDLGPNDPPTVDEAAEILRRAIDTTDDEAAEALDVLLSAARREDEDPGD